MRVGDADGYGQYGIIDGDDKRILCHECGRTYKSLAAHVQMAHQMTAEDYRAAHGIPKRIPLISPEVSAAKSEKSKAQVGSAAWVRFEAKRDPTAASHARDKTAFQRRGADIEAQSERARQNIKGAKKKIRPCVVCGRPPMKIQMTNPACSGLCSRIHHYRASSNGAQAAKWWLLCSEGKSLSAIGRQYGCSHTNVRVTVLRWQEHMSDVREMLRRTPSAPLREWERDYLQNSERPHPAKGEGQNQATSG
ncbi:TPA: MucR family transcriptional regulator [Corynebacterium striatum]|nr:MucR family transcriptional regulator [Corynebacterium striatum]HAT6564278.1 MucR family transcriptional regulator [Corynebacterium striatum]HAT6569740.1 MucR family transcriptional regulator [Corynebacterium striatum]